MTIQEEIEKLDKEIQKLNIPFDKGLPILQEKLWAIAEKHNTTGADILSLYMSWKSGQLKK